MSYIYQSTEPQTSTLHTINQDGNYLLFLIYNLGQFIVILIQWSFQIGISLRSSFNILFLINYLQPLKHGRTIPLPVLEEFFFSHTTSISFSLNFTERILTGSGLFLDCTAEVMHSVDKFQKGIDFFLIINT